jgi:PIN domain nuclease of toxin-antitoxin system
MSMSNTMRLLLDTHVFLWWVGNSKELSVAAREAISDTGNECFVSLASCWELSIKCSLGKLRLSQSIEQFIPEQMAANGFRLLPIEFMHISLIENMQFHHRDPFDRLLIAQAKAEKLTVVTADSAFALYNVNRLW